MKIQFKLAITILIIFLVNTVQAQKVKLNDLDVKVNYLLFPAVGLPNEITTYNVKLSCDENALGYLGYTPSGIKSSINIPGYTKVDELVGATIDFTISGPTGATGKLITEDKKNDKGVTWKEYYYQIAFTGSALLKVYDQNMKSIKEYAIPYAATKNTSTYRSSTEAYNDFNKNTEKMYSDGRKEALSTLISNASRFIIDDFGYRSKSEKIELRSLKEKEHPEYNLYFKKENDIIAAFQKMTTDNIEDYKLAIKPFVDFWSTQEAKYSGTDKEQKKLKFACQYNAALASYWADDFANAKKYASMVAAGTEDEKDGKKLLEKITKVEAELKRVNRPSRHFKIELSADDKMKQDEAASKRAALIASGDISQFPDFNSKLFVNVGTRVEKGIVNHSNGRVDTGYFAYEAEDVRPDFREPKKIRFGYLKAGNIEVGTLDYSGIKAMQIKDLKFAIEDVTLGSGLMKVSLNNAIVEIIKDYKRTSFTIIYPPFKNAQAILGTSNDNLEPSYAVYNKETKKYLPIDGLTGPSKALKKIVEGCAEAEAFVEAKKDEISKKSVLYKMSAVGNPDVVIEALTKYDNCK